MNHKDPVKCHCKNRCDRKDKHKRGYCPCYGNGTACTYLCTCGQGKLPCSNRLGDNSDSEEEELVDDPDFEDDLNTSLVVYFEDHDNPIEVSTQNDSDLNRSLQLVANEAANIDNTTKTLSDVEDVTTGTASLNVVQADTSPSQCLTSEISLMPQPKLQQLVLKLAAYYPELVAAAMEPEPQPQPPDVIPPFCHCGKCRPMPTPQEQLCCRTRNGRCITLEHAGPMHQIVLSKRALQVAVQNHNEYCAQNDSPDNHDTLRHMAYRQYILWRKGRLGVGNRVVIPSCVVWTVRDKFPSTSGTYTGFLLPRIL